ncbi:hypothetical protein [Nonomuraea typhae]|uniref:B12-dependent ribonucleotide reductase insertion domain-containing protein n=1 Tax=Nonomuraea typhae TaxID=2603600 RepID=A0ABW7YJ58_9ACTN
MTILNPDGSIVDSYQNFVALSRYARWRDELGRRETWTESVDRYFDFMLTHLKRTFGYIPSDRLAAELSNSVKHLDLVPSMRALMTAGLALERSNIAGYNCAYLPVDDIAAFSETLFILLNGTGVGFSVESRYVDRLPRVPEIFLARDITIQVGDSKLGWGEAYKRLIEYMWVRGLQPGYDLSAVRPAGARLKTFGGRASGPEPLKELFDYTIDLLWEAQGRRLRPLEVHDLMCKIASVVVVGGVRRAAMISLSDLADQEMAKAKTSNWYETHPHRALANNSAVYEGEFTYAAFNWEWENLKASGSGERGIFSRNAARDQASRNGRRSSEVEYGVNPCAEILLRTHQFCNLSEVIVRAEDTRRDLVKKVKLATILGTWQATLTDFPFLRPVWRENTEEERLLGVSLTGIFGNRLLVDEEGREDLLAEMWATAQDANEVEARKIGIPISAAITTVKPSGTVSQLAGVSSGIHPWHSRQYIRTVRADAKDPLAQLMKDYRVPNEPDVMQDSNMVFSFPIKAPDLGVTRDKLAAIEHLETWLSFKKTWCDHNPSVTISVREDEWEAVGDWVWHHLDELTGVSFLPYSEHVYEQAPYQEIDYGTWRAATIAFPRVEWSDLSFYETSDGTAGAQTLACSADGSGCDSADLVTT